MKIKELLNSAVGVLMPRNCSVCGKLLDSDEKHICRGCLMKMPRTHYEDIDFNAFEQIMAGKVPIERCASYFFYQKNDPYASILHDIKYHNMPTMGRWLTERATREMLPSHFFDGIDAIVPVPLHYTKLASRGYNQSQYLAQGISKAIGAPVIRALTAVGEHSTQTHKDAAERLLNTQGMYAASLRHCRGLDSKHLLIVDDVVTTGSTLLACATALKAAIPDVKLSLFTLAAAQLE
jgi:ComF family protein